MSSPLSMLTIYQEHPFLSLTTMSTTYSLAQFIILLLHISDDENVVIQLLFYGTFDWYIPRYGVALFVDTMEISPCNFGIHLSLRNTTTGVHALQLTVAGWWSNYFVRTLIYCSILLSHGCKVETHATQNTHSSSS